MADNTISALVDQSAIIFQGTVRASGASTIREVAASDAVAIVRADKILLAPPALGNLNGSELTVRWRGASRPSEGAQAIFFTNPWIYGTDIGVVEIGRVDSLKASEVASEIENQPIRALALRLADTELVVAGKVEKVEPSGLAEPVSHHSPRWMRATVQVESIEKGTLPPGRASVLFASAQDVKWRWAPRLQAGQEGVFLMRRGQGPFAPKDACTITDPRDVQSKDALPRIKKLLK